MSCNYAPYFIPLEINSLANDNTSLATIREQKVERRLFINQIEKIVIDVPQSASTLVKFKLELNGNVLFPQNSADGYYHCYGERRFEIPLSQTLDNVENTFKLSGYNEDESHNHTIEVLIIGRQLRG